MDEIDLERLAGGYRYRPAGAAARARARREADGAGLGPGSVALDVGGGRGDHAAEFARRGAAAIVVDRSPTMAAAAAGVVSAVVGDGRRLPIADASADLVYFHVSIHYGGWEAMLAEAVRVARVGGRVTVWTLSAEHVAHSFLSRWFPRIAEIDAARFPAPTAVAERLRDLGCDEVSIDAETEIVERAAASWERAVRQGFVSTLQLLAPEELEAGLALFGEAHPDPASPVRYELDYRRVSGRAPRLRLR